MTIQRGEIYRFNLEPTLGSEQRGDARPCLILSLSAFNAKLRTVGVVPLSSSPRPLPPIIVALSSAGHPNSTALCGQLRTLDKRRIVGGLMGRVSRDDLAEVERNVRIFFGL
jgi:mRNA interferase MazF